MTLGRAKAVITGRWREDVEPVDVWAGDMTDQGYPNAPLELESYRASQVGTAGIFRTEYGWYPVLHYHDSDDSLAFEMDTTRTLPPSDLDRAIIKRADAMLSSMAIWNRADDRTCPAGAPTVSIYCAMERAQIETAGGAHHRRPAMELVREIVDERSAGRNYSHRLMDYNNDSRTTLADTHSLFAEALVRMDSSVHSASGSSSSASATRAGPTPPPTTSTTDRRVVERAQELIRTSDKWNRAETQQCAPDAKTFGIYCALQKAVADVTGQSDDQNPVIRDARAVADFVSAKQYPARLVNYNNDPNTSFEDIQAFFRILKNRIVRRSGG
jgi:hypothetical protein